MTLTFSNFIKIWIFFFFAGCLLPTILLSLIELRHNFFLTWILVKQVYLHFPPRLPKKYKRGLSLKWSTARLRRNFFSSHGFTDKNWIRATLNFWLNLEKTLSFKKSLHPSIKNEFTFSKYIFCFGNFLLRVIKRKSSGIARFTYSDSNWRIWIVLKNGRVSLISKLVFLLFRSLRWTLNKD